MPVAPGRGLSVIDFVGAEGEIDRCGARSPGRSWTPTTIINGD